MEIRKIENSNNPKYLALISECGSVFHSPEWLAVNRDTLQLCGIYNDENLIGAFFYSTIRKGPLIFHSNPQFCPSIGWIFNSGATNQSKILTATKKALELTAEYFDSLSGTVLRCSMPPDVTDMQPFIWKNFKVIPGYTYHHSLLNSTDEIMRRISPEHRNLMKKAEKDGIISKESSDLELVKSLIKKTFDRKEKSLNEKILDRILFEYSVSGKYFAHVAYKNEKPIAATFHIYDQHKAYYLLSGYDPMEKHGGAGILNIMNAMWKAKELGITTYDFEGSMLTEVERFFRGFGPELIPYFTFSKSSLVMEMALKTRMRHIF